MTVDTPPAQFIDYQKAIDMLDDGLRRQFVENALGEQLNSRDFFVRGTLLDPDERALFMESFITKHKTEYDWFRNGEHLTEPNDDAVLSRFDRAWVAYVMTLSAITRGRIVVTNIEPGQEVSWSDELTRRMAQRRVLGGAAMDKVIELRFADDMNIESDIESTPALIS